MRIYLKNLTVFVFVMTMISIDICADTAARAKTFILGHKDPRK